MIRWLELSAITAQRASARPGARPTLVAASLNLSRVTNTDVVLSFIGAPAGEETVAVAVGTSLGGMDSVQHNANARDILKTPETTSRRAREFDAWIPNCCYMYMYM
jgi:hypothetical protein